MSKKIQLVTGHYVILDEEDYQLYKSLSWGINSMGYARRTVRCKINPGGYKTVLLHRLIMNISDPDIKIDHINGDKLDNRRCNLRICSQSQNMQNRKKNAISQNLYKGTEYDKRLKKRPYSARIVVNGKRISLGVFKTEKEAAIAYNEAAIKYFGDFAKLNII